MNKRVLLVAGSALAFTLVIGLAAVPVKQRCGHPHYACATAPDERGYVHYHFEVKPLGVVLVEAVAGAHIPLHYSSGTDLVKRGGPVSPR